MRILSITLVIFSSAACVAKVAVAGGAPPSLLNGLCLLAGLTALLLTVSNRRPDTWLDGPRLILILLGLWYLPSVYHRVGGDGYEYFAQARSLLFDRDLDVTNDYRGLGTGGAVSPQGQMVSRVPIGVPLLWIPVIAAAHVGVKIASWLGASVEANGFSFVYQSAVTTATYVYAFLGLLLIEGMLRKRFDRIVTLLAVVAIWLATPLHFYMTANPSMSHGVSVLVVGAFISMWLKARNGDDSRLWLLTGLSGGLVALVRAQDGVLLILPLVDLITSDRPHRLKDIGFTLLGPALCGLLQGIVWTLVYGPGFVNVVFTYAMVAKETPHILEFLFSPHHGLLSWTPIYLGSLLGWILWIRHSPRLALSFWLAFAAALILNSSTGDWWASESFGQRRMIGWVPLFAFGLAEALTFTRRRPMALAGTVIVFLILWNLQLAYIYNSELAGRRDQAIHLDRLAAAQVDVTYRNLLRFRDWIPPKIWNLSYDAIKGVWLFGGDRSLEGRVDFGNEPEDFYPFVEYGWFGPETSDGITYRLSRGRRSRVSVPIRRPSALRLTLRAQLLLTSVPVTLNVRVNGEDVSSAELEEGWNDYVFDVSAEVMRPGFNTVTFVYSTTPRLAIPGFHGRNAVIAADWLQFQPH